MIKILRYSDNGDSTLGLTLIDGKFFCYTLEDEEREIKIKGETRIPEGVYKLGIRQGLTPMTKKYQNRYDWFENHIENLHIPNFKYVYIHIGNYERDTAGCLLLGDAPNNNQIKKGKVGESTNAFKRFYEKIFPKLKAGEEILIEFKDIEE